MELTTADVARLFGVSAGTVIRWVQDGNLPTSEVNSQYRFNREELLEWATIHKLAIPPAILPLVGGEQVAGPGLADALTYGGVAYRVAGDDRQALLANALQGLPLPTEVDREALLGLFMARERLGTTTVGDGIAIPHPRCPLVLSLPRSAVRLCFLTQSHDFGAADGKPVDTLFLMVCRTVHEHLRLLVLGHRASERWFSSGVGAASGGSRDHCRRAAGGSSGSMSQLLLGLAILVAGGLLALLLTRSARVANAVGAIAAVAGGIVALVPVLSVLVSGRSIPELSCAWNVPYGSLSVGLDPLSAWFAAAILGLGVLAAIYGAGYLPHYATRKSLGPPWLFFNLLIAAMVLVVMVRNGVLFLVAWETMALASYFLVTFEDELSDVRDAGRIYLIASHLGTACLLLFFALFAVWAGSLDFSVLAKARLTAQWSSSIAGTLFVLALVGFGTKAGFMPLHVWLPEAHPAAPSHVSAVMSGVMIKTGIYGLLAL